jgi:hypothetical protein
VILLRVSSRLDGLKGIGPTLVLIPTIEINIEQPRRRVLRPRNAGDPRLKGQRSEGGMLLLFLNRQGHRPGDRVLETVIQATWCLLSYADAHKV